METFMWYPGLPMWYWKIYYRKTWQLFWSGHSFMFRTRQKTFNLLPIKKRIKNEKNNNYFLFVSIALPDPKERIKITSLELHPWMPEMKKVEGDWYGNNIPMFAGKKWTYASCQLWKNRKTGNIMAWKKRWRSLQKHSS